MEHGDTKKGLELVSAAISTTQYINILGKKKKKKRSVVSIMLSSVHFFLFWNIVWILQIALLRIKKKMFHQNKNCVIKTNPELQKRDTEKETTNIFELFLHNLLFNVN